MNVKFKKLVSFAIVPNQATPGDAGLDLYALHDEKVEPGKVSIISTGIACAIPERHVGLVCPRSGLAAKYGITVVNAPGVIDSSYRGEIKVLLTTLVDRFYKIQEGDRIAQLLIVPCLCEGGFPASEEVDELPPTLRGEAGFGSTGR